MVRNWPKLSPSGTKKASNFLCPSTTADLRLRRSSLWLSVLKKRMVAKSLWILWSMWIGSFRSSFWRRVAVPGITQTTWSLVQWQSLLGDAAKSRHAVTTIQLKASSKQEAGLHEECWQRSVLPNMRDAVINPYSNVIFDGMETLSIHYVCWPLSSFE